MCRSPAPQTHTAALSASASEARALPELRPSDLHGSGAYGLTRVTREQKRSRAYIGLVIRLPKTERHVHFRTSSRRCSQLGWESQQLSGIRGGCALMGAICGGTEEVLVRPQTGRGAFWGSQAIGGREIPRMVVPQRWSSEAHGSSAQKPGKTSDCRAHGAAQQVL